MQAALQIILLLVQTYAPSATATIVAQIISALETLIPLVVAEYKALSPIVKNIIDALRGNGSITTEQLDALDAMEAVIDANFDQALTDAEKADGAGG